MSAVKDKLPRPLTDFKSGWVFHSYVQHTENVVEKTMGVKSFCISDGNFKNKNEFICDIISRYKNHPSIVKVKKMILHNEAYPQLFNFK